MMRQAPVAGRAGAAGARAGTGARARAGAMRGAGGGLGRPSGAPPPAPAAGLEGRGGEDGGKDAGPRPLAPMDSDELGAYVREELAKLEGGGGGAGALARAGGDFADVRKKLLKRTAASSAVLVGYLLLVVGPGASASAALGVAGAFAYLRGLFDEVGGELAEPVVALPMDRLRAKRARNFQMSTSEAIEDPLQRKLAEVRGVYTQALKPRFLAPVGVAAVVTVVNSVSWAIAGFVEPEPLNFGFAVAGFLAFKPAMLLAVWDDCLQFLIPEYDQDEILAKYRS